MVAPLRRHCDSHRIPRMETMTATDTIASPAALERAGVGCWAEHRDGSMAVVEALLNGQVHYLVIDRTGRAIIERWGRIPLARFRRECAPGGLLADGWAWHDSPFPAERAYKPLRDPRRPSDTAAGRVADRAHAIGLALADR